MTDQPTTTYRLTPRTLDLFVRALVNEVDYDIHKGYECGEEDGLDHYPELVAEAAKMLSAIAAGEPAAAAPVDLSEWAINLGADGLEPLPEQLSAQTDNGPWFRLHFAVRPDMPDDMRRALVEGVGVEIAKRFFPQP